MFGRNGSGGDPGDPANPSDNTPAPPEPSGSTQPQLPNWRVWCVRRFKYTATANETVLEEVMVSAMLVQVTDAGGLIFSVWRIDPVLGPTTGAVRGFATYYDFEEVPQAPPSLLAH